MNTLESQQKALVDVIRFLHGKGWAPATSSNYSFRPAGAGEIWISASGRDKGDFRVEDLMCVGTDGRPLDDERRPSAETALHTMLYDRFPGTGCVLHTHTVFNTVLSRHFRGQGALWLEGYEVLKGIAGVTTHETRVAVPVFPNSQDIPALARDARDYLDKHPHCKAFLLDGHGLYTWAAGIAETKRQVEVFEFLFECEYRSMLLPEK